MVSEWNHNMSKIFPPWRIHYFYETMYIWKNKWNFPAFFCQVNPTSRVIDIITYNVS